MSRECAETETQILKGENEVLVVQCFKCSRRSRRMTTEGREAALAVSSCIVTGMRAVLVEWPALKQKLLGSRRLF